MKKKIKSPSNNEEKDRDRNSSIFLIIFIFVVIFCLFGATMNAFMFCKSFFRSLTKANETPIATITFKYKTAERRFSDRVIWDRLRQNSPLYNGDIIHTEVLSEATIHFVDGNTLDLAESSMVQVFITEDGIAAARVGEGSATVDSSDSSGGMAFTVNGMVVTVDKGSSVSAGNGQMLVLEGSASVKGESGNVSVSQGEGVLLEEDGQEMRIIVTSPAPSAKVLYFTQGDANIPFSWNVSGSSVEGGLALEVAKDRDFTKSVYSSTKGNLQSGTSGQEDVSLGNGSYYWRLAAGRTGEVIASSRLQIVQSLPPYLLVPVEGYTYTYRNSSPAVRLIWTESPQASSYKLEISSDSSFLNRAVDTTLDGTSAIISTLTEGRWWWRVTPYYPVNHIGYGQPSEVSSFVIERKSRLEPPMLLVPADNSAINISSEKGVNFSWKGDRETVGYTIVFSRSADLSGELKQIDVSSNYYVLSPEEKLEDGKWYWTVIAKDTDGNTARSAVRSFYTVDGTMEQHTIEPPDGYGIAMSLLPDTTFSWKKNLPPSFTTEIQVATDASFNNIVYSSEVTGLSTRVRGLSVGQYYWRIVSRSSSSVLESPAKRFSVLDSLPVTQMTVPLSGEKAVVREGKPYSFEWNKIDGADYYRVQIYDEASNKSVFQDVVYSNKVDVNMYSDPGFEDKKNYRIEIQGVSNAVAGVSSRRSGRLSQSSFLLAKLRPVKVTSPSRGSKIDGFEAVYNPPVARWSSEEEPARAQLVLLRTDLEAPAVVMKVPGDEAMAAGNNVAPASVRLKPKDGLKPGTYQIIVYAVTADGIDISSTAEKDKGSFTVLPVPPLDDPKKLDVSPARFDQKYLADADNERVIRFKWQSVEGANDYSIKVYDSENNVIIEEYVGDKKEYSIDFMNLTPKQKIALSEGKFTWTVQALRRVDTDKDGRVDSILQESPEIESSFVTDIPVPNKAKTRKALNPYGK